jgi:hypothetical protein
MTSTDTMQPGSAIEASQESLAPTLQFCVLCDLVAAGPGGKPAFVGVFDQCRRLGPIPQFFIVMRWINGLGSHRSSIRLLDPNLNPIFVPPEPYQMTLRRRTDVANSQYGIVNLTFPQPGVYWVEISLDDQFYASIPLPVFEG